MEPKEQDYYSILKQRFRELYESKGCKVYLEITARGFTNKLKEQIPQSRNIIFSFIGAKGIYPDITGFVEKEYSKEFIVAEAKNEKVKLDHIYQLKKYADLLDAKFAFLISTKEIPAEIKALSKIEWKVLGRDYPLPQLTLVRFNRDANQFVEWFEENPFEKELYWR